MFLKQKRRNRGFYAKGQTMVEYLIIFAVALAVMIAFLRPGGFFFNSLNETTAISINILNSTATRIFR